jgi:hypothetical protein
MAPIDIDYVGAIAVQYSDRSWFTVAYTGKDIKRGARVFTQAKNKLHGRVLIIDHERYTRS